MLSTLFLFLLLEKAKGLEHTILTPKALRVGAQDTGILNLHGYQAATLSYFLQDMPNLQSTFSQFDNIALDAEACSKPIPLTLTVTKDDIRAFVEGQTVKLTVQITGSASDFSDTVEILASEASGYIFIATDRPAYRPKDRVRIRVFPLTQSLSPSRQNVDIIVKTPDGVGISRTRRQRPENDFLDFHFNLPEDPVFGRWSVESLYAEEGYSTSTEISFLVERYVLPTFKVTIETKPYFLVSDDHLNGTVKASYSYGKEVDGNYYLSVKLRKTPTGSSIEIYKEPDKKQYSAPFVRGQKKFSVKSAFISAHLKEGETLQTISAAGGFLHIDATVTGTADGVLESAVIPSIPIVTSPYVIDQERVAQNFIPFLTYTVQVDIKDAAAGTAIRGVVVVVTAGEREYPPTISDENGQINFLIEFAQNQNQDQVIEVATRQPDLAAADQATARFTVKPYVSPSNSFLQVTTTDHVVERGHQLQVVFSYQPLPLRSEIRYFVLSRGMIVHHDFVRPVAANQQTTVRITATQSMIPSSRLVAYYLNGNEVVSVSMWFMVVSRCKQELEVTVPEEVSPGRVVTFQLQGAPNSVVSLIGVDRAAYFLYNQSRLTRSSLFDKIAKSDQGCVRHGGANGQDVFTGAGLLLATNNLQPVAVDSLNCNRGVAGKRRKRTTNNQVDATLVREMLEKCRRQGGLKSVTGEGCQQRAKRVKENFDSTFSTCSKEFQAACVVATVNRFKAILRGQYARANGEAENAAERLAEVAIRSDFGENLVFTTVHLDAEGNSGRVNRKSRDSITTFDIDAVSMQENAEEGFCVAKPAQVRAFKPVFIQVYTPYSLRIREQAGLRLAIFNYGQLQEKVLLEVKPNRDLCTYYQSGQWSRILNTTVLPSKSSSSSITVLPLRIPNNGKANIELRVVSQRDGRVLDSVRKELLIEERGEVKDITGRSSPIDLRQQRSINFNLHLRFPEFFVFGSRKCWIYAYTNFLGPTIEVDPITEEPRNVHSFFRLPSGCGEQLMGKSGQLVYAHAYLVDTNKIQPGTPRYQQSLNYIEQGYSRQQSHRTNRDRRRPWAVYNNSPPRIGLNSYVNKVYSKAKQYIPNLDVGPICSSLDWMLDQQGIDGSFISIAESLGILISMEESRSVCSSALNKRVVASAARIETYLSANRNNAAFKVPRGAAKLTYAFALRNPTSALTRDLNSRLLSMKQTIEALDLVYWKGAGSNQIAGINTQAYWQTQRPTPSDVEATAYALLAQVTIAKSKQSVTVEEYALTRNIAKWLISARNEVGAFISTQDTVIGLQALAAYKAWFDNVDPPSQETDINLTFRGAPGTDWAPGSEHQEHMDESNENFRLEVEVPEAVFQSETVHVTASGFGEGVLSYRCVYRSQVEEDVCSIKLDVDLTSVAGRSNQVVKITVRVSKPDGPPIGVGMVEVGLLSGYVAVTETLNRLAASHVVDGIIDRYEESDQKVILYLREITNEPLALTFHMLKFIPVAKPEPAKVKVYDYYEPTVQCGKFYALPGHLETLRTANCNGDNDLCKCAEGGCPKCRTRDEQLSDSACVEGGPGNCPTCSNPPCKDVYNDACRSKFAFIVEITHTLPKYSNEVFVEFKASVLSILKKGNDVGVQRNSERLFVTRNDCINQCRDQALENAARNSGNSDRFLRKGMVLFVFGKIQDRYRKRNNVVTETYFLDDQAVLERYIPQRKCESQRRRYNRFNCDVPTPAVAQRCSIITRFIAACDNMAKIQRKLVSECD